MSDLLAGLGVVAAAGLAAAAILLPPGRARAAALLAALLLAPTLVLADQWNSPQVTDLRDDPARFAGFALATAAGAIALAAAFRRWPLLLPLAIVFALPFRVPLESGGDTANLLVPLYLVIGGGVLAVALGELGWRRAASPGTGPAGRAAEWLPRALAAVVVLYALQTLYSPDFSKSLQYACFFFVPFSLAFVLMRDVAWDRRLLTIVLGVVVAEGIVFVAVGSVEYLTESLFWNDQVIRSNEFHTYFRVNSVFWDPNIYGRYLALAIVLATAGLLWARGPRAPAVLAALIGILWIGLVPTFSQSSFAALLGGLAVLAALRWSLRWTLAAVAAAAAVGVAVVIFVGGVSKLSPTRINVDTAGRANLVSGGAELFARRPVWGYGAGSFQRAYREHIATRKAPVSASHTQPVTVGAEQGLIGLAAYLALLASALWAMVAGLRPATAQIGRIAVLAAFVALLVHTLGYAGFFEDPISWVLLALGASLATPAIRPET